MFTTHSKNPGNYLLALPGIYRRTLVHGSRTLMTEFLLEKGADLPSHQHPQEQTGYLVSGQMILVIGDQEHKVGPGDSWAIPGGVEHRAEVLEDSVALEVFSPVREDYLQKD
ncbi:MAG: cupin domain-containing protein [Chitinophagales bacterium]